MTYSSKRSRLGNNPPIVIIRMQLYGRYLLCDSECILDGVWFQRKMNRVVLYLVLMPDF